MRESPPIDLGVLADSIGEDPELQEEILRDFERVLAEARGALSRTLPHDLGEAAEIAHRVKGSSRQIGAAALSSALQALEDAARDRRAEPARGAAVRVDAEAVRCADWLRARREGAA
jgi:HPt (histidine-containing phosphotransfer) domain-containing protein